MTTQQAAGRRVQSIPAADRAGRRSWPVPAALLALSLVPVAAGVVRLIQLAGGPELIPADQRFADFPLPLVVHIVGATTYAVVGAFQFLPRFRSRHPGWHRRAGRVLAVAGLLVAASAIWMTLFYARQPGTGDLLYGLRLAFGSAMTACLVLGVTTIRRGDVARPPRLDDPRLRHRAGGGDTGVHHRNRRGAAGYRRHPRRHGQRRRVGDQPRSRRVADPPPAPTRYTPTCPLAVPPIPVGSSRSVRMIAPDRVIYQVRVRGHLDEHWSAWFGNLDIDRREDGTSTLTGPVTDQAQLHGVLAGLRDMGITLISVQALEYSADDAASDA